MFLAAIVIVFALIVIVLIADHNGYIRAMKQVDRDIDKIFIEVLKQKYDELTSQ